MTGLSAVRSVVAVVAGRAPDAELGIWIPWVVSLVAALEVDHIRFSTLVVSDTAMSYSTLFTALPDQKQACLDAGTPVARIKLLGVHGDLFLAMTGKRPQRENAALRGLFRSGQTAFFPVSLAGFFYSPTCRGT
jgi:hypothetical protein